MVAVCTGIAIACGIFVLLSANQQALAVVVAVVVLALAQLFLAIMNWATATSHEEALHAFIEQRRRADDERNANFVANDSFEREVSDLKRRSLRTEKDLQEIRQASSDQFLQLTARYEAAAANNARHIEEQPSVSAATQTPKEQLNFLLQPIIDLTTNETAHYRARFSMSAPTGGEIDFEKLILNADRGGLRASLDVHVIHQAIPLLRRLRAKSPAMKMFLPVGTATLMSDQAIALISATLAEAADVATGVVLELNHASLGRMSEAGIAGLAKIARSGAVLAVADAAIAGLDLAALRKLGVKFIAIDAGSIYSGYTIASTWQEFAQVARGLQFQIMITDINNPTQAAASAQIARLVTGTYFAPARRVKVNAGASRRSSATVAA